VRPTTLAYLAMPEHAHPGDGNAPPARMEGTAMVVQDPDDVAGVGLLDSHESREAREARGD
jgi:hypothetical protein